VLAVRWYLRFGLSYRDVEELLAERGVEVDHVTIYRWVQRFSPLLAEAARPCRHAVGDRWFVDETLRQDRRPLAVYPTVRSTSSGRSSTCTSRLGGTPRRRGGSSTGRSGPPRVTPVEVVTDRAAAYPRVLDELVPAAWHRTDRYGNNRIEADHG
jgi:transposase, IS6 family